MTWSLGHHKNVNLILEGRNKTGTWECVSYLLDSIEHKEQHGLA